MSSTDLDSKQPSEIELIPVGIFGAKFGLWDPRTMSELAASCDRIDPGVRLDLARYLRAGTMVMPFMEFTRDILNEKFGVPGGSSILTDGLYYWRLDAADYVETYGIEVPAEFIERARRHEWRPPSVGAEERARIDELLSAVLRG